MPDHTAGIGGKEIRKVTRTSGGGVSGVLGRGKVRSEEKEIEVGLRGLGGLKIH